MQLVMGLGPKTWKDLFLHLEAGDYPNWPQGATDDTHLSPEGARAVALLAADEMKIRRIDLARYLR